MGLQSQTELIRNGNFDEVQFPLSPQKSEYFQYYFINWITCKDWYSCNSNATHGKVVSPRTCGTKSCGEEYTLKLKSQNDSSGFSFIYHNAHLDSMPLNDYCQCAPCGCRNDAIAYREYVSKTKLIGFWYTSDSIDLYYPSSIRRDTYRDYFGTKLKQKLVPGKSYKLVFKHWVGGGPSKALDLGVAFTTYKALQKNNERLGIKPQFQQRNFVSTSYYSPKTEFSFVADSAFEYLTVGCFLKNSDIKRRWLPDPNDPRGINNFWSLNYLDSFSLIETLIPPKISGPKMICRPGKVKLYSGSGYNTVWYTSADTSMKITGDSILLTVNSGIRVYASHDGFLDSLDINLIHSPKNFLKDTFVFDNKPITLNYPYIDGYRYSWDASITDTFRQITFSQTGKHFIVLKSKENCIYLDSFNLKNVSVNFQILSSDSVCVNHRLKLYTNRSPQQYQWFLKNDHLGHDSVIEIQFDEYGKKLIHACIDTLGYKICDSIEIRVDQKPESNLSSLAKHCMGNSTEICITINPKPSVFQWDNGAKSTCRTFDESGLYYLESYNGACRSKDSIKIVEWPLPKFRIEQNDTPCLDGLNEAALIILPDSFLKYEWQPLGIEKNKILINDTGSFKVKVTDNHGCFSQMIYVVQSNCYPSIIVPNSVSPNGDGVNDEFKIIGHHILSCEITVYNRWGELLYSNTSPDAFWDCKFKGELVSQGQYLVKLKVITQGQNNQSPIHYMELLLNVLR